MTAMVTFSWIGIMLLVGVVLRAVIKPLGNILMPASVIGGIVGLIMMNIPGVAATLGIDPNMCNQIVNFFFILSFISMGLTATPKAEGQTGGAVAKQQLRGSMGMGLLWGALYCFTPVIGYFCIKFFGAAFNMPAEYGILIPFAFCQGPGQSASFGMQIEAAGLMPLASQVAITYSVIGFLFAFLIGVPLAKIGLKKGLASYPEKLSPAVMRGIYKPEEQTEVAGRITTYNGNIDVLAFNFAIVGMTFVITLYVQKLILMVPNALIASFGGMTFFVGYFVALLVKAVMTKIGVKKYHDDALQARITGCTTDFLIVGAFMAIQTSAIGSWIIPMLMMCVVVGAFTFAFCIYFGRRFGDGCDFERTLGMWGCATGTCPSGVALIRVVDPNLRTTASAEMGSMNAFMIPGTLLVANYIMVCNGLMSINTLIPMALGLGIINIILIKVVRAWNKPTFSWKGKVVCPDVTDDCEAFENTGTRSQF